jgi:glycerol-3-phosphate dehydrogenase (NAD(P)+)
MRALVVGATSWGCTLALQLDRAGAAAVVLCRDPDEAARLDADRENRRLLPGIGLPAGLQFTHDPAIAGSLDAIILAVPMQRLRENMDAVLALPGALPPIVSAAKGLELGSHLRASQVIAQELARDGRAAPICALSGPNIAREIALGQPSATVLACADASVIEPLRGMLMTPGFRVYTNDDVVGVELGGALKNIVAIGSGIGDALDAGANGRAAFLTRGLAEMARLGVAEGAQPMTFAGLAGLGDLIATAISPRSRNHFVGEQLGRGIPLAKILDGMVHVAEGVETTRAARTLARRAGVEMPIVEAMYRVLFEGQRPPDAIRDLMTRGAGDEIAPPPVLPS